MTEIAFRPESTTIAMPNAPTDDAVERLIAWARGAAAAQQLAERLCNTRFVPTAYRGKPVEGAAAILAGSEVGLSPMAAMRAFDDIQGTPAPKAITLRAIVQSRGHTMILEPGATREYCKMRGRRAGEEEWIEVEWDLDRAREMGLLGKDQWKKQPKAMLIARATSELARLVAADAIMGMPYSAEEIRDGDYVDHGAVPSTTPVTSREIVEAITATAASEPQEEMSSKEQRDAVKSALTEKGLTTPAEWQEFICRTLGRNVRYLYEITAAEIAMLSAKVAELPDPPIDGEWSDDAPAWSDGDVQVAEVPA